MKSLIIDDEPKSRKVLRRLCKDYCPQIDVVGEAGSVDEAIQKIDTLKPRLVFLDIHMPAKSGFTLLDHYRDNVDFSVIFTTAYEHYAIEAFKYMVIDYLEKPIDIEELQAAVNRATKVKNITAEQLTALEENLIGKIQKIALATIDGYTFVKLDNIIRCEAQGNYTLVYLKNGDSVLITKTLKYYEDLLHDKLFFRVHKSHLINLKCVRKFLKGKKGMVEMIDGSQVEVSIQKREILLDNLAKIN